MGRSKQQRLPINEDQPLHRRTYVIAGDWVVDENWFLVRHYSELSKHTGEAHYRRLEAADGKDDADPSKILELCGAGHIARVLYLERQIKTETLNGSNDGHEPLPAYDLLAIGKWHLGDQPYLTHLIHSGLDESKCPAGRPGHRIVYPEVCETPPKGITLHTLSPKAPTFRAVRLYHQRSGDWHIVNRVDWEPPRRDDNHNLVGDLPPRDNVPVVIIDDLEKGAVTSNLVNKLLKSYPKAVWYVRAKSLHPEWLYPQGKENEIYGKLKNKLALFVIGPEVAPQLSPFECWHHNGHITQEAMDVIGEIPAKNIVILSERRELIGKFRESVIWGKSHVDPTALNQVGWADAVMAGLVHYMNTSPDSPAEITEEVVEHALRMADNRRGVTGTPDGSNPPSEKRHAAPPAPAARKEATNWSREKRNWGFAREKLGIIDGTLEVWRASTRLKGYIACIQDKLAILDEIARHLRAFSRGSRERSLGILIQADPGAGKSHLAKCLTEAFDFDLLACDVSQMIHREELFDFFDKVATRQVSSEKPVLAFVDEINTTIENSTVYGAFLAPLESHHYARRGQLHPLKPCVWLFTGTNAEDDDDDKQSDFFSRMTLRKNIDYKWLHEKPDHDEQKAIIRAAAQLEQVYFGATMIMHHFPDVTEVDRRLLQAFHALDPAASPFRTIRQVAATLRNVQHGRVTIRNVADGDVLGIRPNSLPPAPDMVRLVAN